MYARCMIVPVLLVLAAASCDRRGSQQSARVSPAEAVAEHASDSKLHSGERFEAPGADGWGRAGELKYLERTLGGGRPAEALPLVILIHGLGDAPRFDWLPGASEVATPMRLIMPQAPTPYSGGFAWFPFRREQDPDALAQGIAVAAGKLARSIAILQARRPTLGRAIVAGFSQGGMLSYALALHHPNLLESSLPISGLLPEALWPAQRPSGTLFPPIAAMHGDRDELVPIEPARRLRAHLEQHGYDMTLREFAGARHEINHAMEAYLIELLERAARSVFAAESARSKP